MRCDICNAIIPKPVFNDRTGTFDPCLTCLDEVAAAIKEPSEDDDWYSQYLDDDSDFEGLYDWEL